MGKIMAGKTCLITGANSGIGKALCTTLAEYGANIIMACRSQSRGESALNEIKEKTKNNNIDLLIIDLSSQKSIRDGVQQFKKKYSRLDVLINNAGAIFFKKILTEDGIESTLAVDYLAPFLLTNLLLDVLKSSAPARIINVVSEGTSKGKIDFENLTSEKRFNPALAYSQAKQAEILFTYELAKRLEGTRVTVNSFYPGLVKTNLGNVEKGFFKLTFKIMTTLLKPFFVPIEESIKMGVFLAVSKKAEKITGKYLKRKKDKIVINNSFNREISKRLWEISEKLTGFTKVE